MEKFEYKENILAEGTWMMPGIELFWDGRKFSAIWRNLTIYKFIHIFIYKLNEQKSKLLKFKEN